MKLLAPPHRWTVAPRRPLVIVAAVALAAVLAAYYLLHWGAPAAPPVGAAGEPGPPAASGEVTLAKAKWASAGIRIEPAESGDFRRSVWVTGKLTVNEDRTVHVYPQVEGRVQKVFVHFGQDVRAGDKLAVIASRELAEAKLTLFRNRLDTQIARINAERAAEVNRNTQELIAAIRKNAALDDIEAKFRNKPMGDYRQQLTVAYAHTKKSAIDYERVQAAGVAISGKELLQAKAAAETDQATFESVVEQVQFLARQEALRLQQLLDQAQAQEEISAAKLRILGSAAGSPGDVDPAVQGEAIAHYVLQAPFDATVIHKDAALDEAVSTTTQMFQLADLSAVWLQADVYQKDLPLLANLSTDRVRFRLPHSGEVREATIFYKGDVLDPQTRTVRLLAAAGNPERGLKPGMFVEVELPVAPAADVVQVPDQAVLRSGGETFVFVHAGGEGFAQRPVTVGETAGGRTSVLSGLRPGEPVVTAGTFALKAEAMRDQLGESE